MTKSKNHNSIVFLTTLGVYLGLVLVGGASPQVFAQNALIQDFNIYRELHFDDGFDKKPRGEQALDTYASLLEDSVRATFIGLKNPAINQRAFWAYDLTVRENGTQGTFEISGADEGRIYSGLLSASRLVYAFENDADTSSRYEPVKIQFRMFPAEVHFQIELRRNSAPEASAFAAFYDQALSKLKERRLSDLRKVLYSNTQVFANDNKVTIVSHLPRASIEPLFANKNAQ